MTKEILALALESEGLKAGAQGITFPDEREATVLVSTPGDLLTVARVVALDLRDKYIYMRTAKDERFFFAYEDVLGLRLSGKAEARERSAGFSR